MGVAQAMHVAPWCGRPRPRRGLASPGNRSPRVPRPHLDHRPTALLPPPPLTQFAPGRTASLAQLATDAVDTRGRTFTYSHYPIQHVPWDNLVARDALMSLTTFAVHAGIAGVLIAGYVSPQPAALPPQRHGRQ